MKKKLIVGTRGSFLALTQTNMVIEELKEKCSDLEIDIKIIKTTGDKILNKTLDKIGGKSLFVKEIEEALNNSEIDFAVHSMKDMPFDIPKDFTIAAILKREDPRDILISRDNKMLSELRTGATIGTSSLRRGVQLLRIRKDISIVPIRGNIDSRIKRVENGELDGIILAAAGVKRMGWEDKITQYLTVNESIPSVGQGALAIEVRKADTSLCQLIRGLNNDLDSKCILAERAFLKEMKGSCSIPIGAYGYINENDLYLTGFISEIDGSNFRIDTVSGDYMEYIKLGQDLARKLQKR